MRSWNGLWPLALIGLGAALWILFASEPGAKWLAATLSHKEAVGLPVGRLMTLNGTLKHIRDGHLEFYKTPLSSALELRDGDRVELDAGSNAVVSLTSGDELQLLPLSSLGMQLWVPTDANSPVYLTLFAGDFDLRSAGLKGRAYVVREGRLYLPGQKPSNLAPSLTVKKPANISLSDSNPLEDGDFATDGGASTEEIDEGSNQQNWASEPETLANEYIDEMISNRQGQIQKCWLSRLKDKPDLKGQLVVQFEIHRRGRVKEARVTDASFDDDQLKKCVQVVFERLSFRSFKGPEIVLSYPIQFE